MRSDAQQNRERILAAAEDVFGERGPSGSTEEVARRAGVGIATVFRHYPTKEALIEAALVRHFAELTERTRRLSGSDDPVGAFRTLVRAMIETGAIKLTLASLLDQRGGLPARAIAASDDLRDAVAGLLRDAQDAGSVDSAVTVDELYLIIRGLAQASATAPVPRATLRRAADIVLAGMAAGPA